MITKEHLFNGILSYIDGEVIPSLPTSGKWAMGAIMALASPNISKIIDSTMNNSLVKSIGVIDDAGNIDSDKLIDALKSSASKYGKLEIVIPVLGTMRFSSDDVHKLGTYVGYRSVNSSNSSTIDGGSGLW